MKMNEMTDIHCHLLPGVDDGARDMADCEELLSIAAADGIRHIVFTPHVRRPWLKRTKAETEEVFGRVREIAAGRFPELTLYLGTEFAFSESILQEEKEKLQDLNGSGVLLTEFRPHDPFSRICEGIQQVQMAGYDVLLAHIERYDCMLEDIDRAYRVAELGAMIQVNADDIASPMSFRMGRWLKKLMAARLIHAAGSDAHDAKYRRPELSKARAIVAKRCGEEYAEELFHTNGLKILEKGSVN